MLRIGGVFMKLLRLMSNFLFQLLPLLLSLQVQLQKQNNKKYFYIENYRFLSYFLIDKGIL